MTSPKERYDNDPTYRGLVDTIESMIVRAYLTPAEVRECAVLACIHYETRHAFKHHTVPSGVNHALQTLSDWREDVKCEETERKQKQETTQ